MHNLVLLHRAMKTTCNVHRGEDIILPADLYKDPPQAAAMEVGSPKQAKEEDDKHNAVESADSVNANENELINSILTKWRNQGCFLRFDPTNSSTGSNNNLVRVPLDDAMDHIDDWVVDWDIYLNQMRLC